MRTSISEKERQVNKLHIPQSLQRSIILTLWLLTLLLGSLVTTQAVVEGLKTERAVDRPMAWSNPQQPGLFHAPTEPLSGSAMRAPNAEAENVEFVGQIGGATRAVSIQGDYAYIGLGPRLAVLDISNPAAPTVVA
jgi:hypothetical protein